MIEGSSSLAEQAAEAAPKAPSSAPDELLFRQFADNIPALAWMANADGYITWYNRRWHEYCGTTPEQMEGWGWQSVHDPEALPAVLERWQLSIATGRRFEMTFPLRGTDGVFRPFLTRVEPFRDETGQVLRWFGTNTDVSGQAIAERAVRESEARFREQFERANDFIFTADLEMRITSCNPSVARALGLMPDELVGRSISEFVPPEIWEKNRAMLAAKIAGEQETTRYEVEVFAPEGGTMIWEINSRLTRDETGAPTGLHAIGRDVTERRRSEKELRESEARLRALTDHLPGGMVYQIATGADGADRRFLYLSQSYEKLFGVPVEAVLADANAAYGRVLPEDQQALADAEAAAIGEGKLFDVEARFRIANEDIRWCRVISAPREQENGSLIWDGLLIDVTDRKRAEEALRESEAQLRLVTDALPVLISYVDAGIRYRFANKAYEEWFGISHEEVVGKTMTEVLGEKAFEQIRSAVDAVLTGERQSFERQLPYRFGKPRHVHIDYVPDRADDGTVSGFYVLVSDVSEAKKAEEALRESEEFNRRILDSSSDCIKVLSLDGKLERMSPGGMRVMEVDDFSVIEGGYWPDFWPGDKHREAVAALEEAREGRTGRFQGLAPTLKGNFRWWDVAVTPIPGPSGAAEKLLSISRDITDQKQAEEALRELNETLEKRVEERTAELMQAQEALRQSQKLEAMGQLTGGVAHDFNNLLAPIIGGLDMLQRRGIGGEREQRLIDGAMQSADRAKTLVQRLLAFARRQPLQPSAVDVGALVAGMADLVASTSGPQIKVEVDLPADLPPAKADPNQLEMAILNLSVNARDAMPDGGTLTISAISRNVVAGEHANLAAGDYVRVSVADTGVGMDQETAARAVEPFFSTKGIGKGTGLGLSMVHGLASQLGGALTISSREGLGTDVALWLPVSHERPDEDDEAAPPAGTEANAGRVLLVDDEALVRASTADMLLELGYSVVEAESAKEALVLLGKERINLVLTDHLMPGLTGTELAQQIRETRPGLPVLVISGYADFEGISPDLPRLTKPFRQADLAAGIAEARDRAA